MDKKYIVGPVFWIIAHIENRGQSEAMVMAKVVGFSVLVLAALAAGIVILSIFVYTVMIENHSFEGYKILFVPNLMSILISSVPIGIIYGLINVRRLNTYLSDHGISLDVFGALTSAECQNLFFGESAEGD